MQKRVRVAVKLHISMVNFSNITRRSRYQSVNKTSRTGEVLFRCYVIHNEYIDSTCIAIVIEIFPVQ